MNFLIICRYNAIRDEKKLTASKILFSFEFPNRNACVVIISFEKLHIYIHINLCIDAAALHKIPKFFNSHRS